MPIVTEHAHGSFCWFELATSDQEAAKQFYASLFGWGTQDSPMGPGETYTMFTMKERPVAAAYTLRPDDRQSGVPPNWMIYVRVENADEAAAAAGRAGGQVLAQPFDVMDVGRMAVVCDPTRAVFSIWEPRRHQGTGLAGENGTAVWADLMTPDQARAAEFYKSVFGWQMVTGKSMTPAAPGEYFHIVNRDQFIGGIPPQGGGTHPAWLIYFGVPDCHETIEHARSIGGRLVFGPETIEGRRRFAALADPQGAIFAVVDGKP